MTASPVTQAPPAAKPPLVRRVVRILAIIVLCLLILIAAVFVFTQTSWFRGIIADQLISTVEEQTNGTLAIGEIEGDLFSGFVLRDVRLSLKNDTATIFEAPTMLAKYSLYDLLTSDRISASEMVLVSPKITFFREKGDSLWNFQKLIKPSDGPVDTAQFRGIIDIGNLRINNGSLSVRDMFFGSIDTVIKKKAGTIDWGYMNIEQLDVDLRAKIFGNSFQVLDLQHVSFVERRSGFWLRRLGGYLSRSDDNVKIEGLELVTNVTALKLTARADSMKVLSGGEFNDMADSKIELHLDASAVNAKELAMFIPDLNFIGNSPGLKLDASGTWSNLQIQKGALNFRRQGTIDFDGAIGNLQDPENIRLDIVLEGENLSQSTLDSYVPGLDIRGFEQYGIVTINRLEYPGGIESFATRFDIASAAGSAEGTGRLDFAGVPKYEAHVITSDLNIGAIINTDDLESNLNLKVDARGSGFDPKTMNTEFVISAYKPSRMSQYTLSSFAASGSINKGVFTGRDIVISMGEGRMLTSEYATIDLVGRDQRFDVAFNTTNFPVAEFIPDLPQTLRLTANANLEGSLITLSGLAGSLQAEINGLYFNGSKLAPVKVDAIFDRDSLGVRYDRIESSIADVIIKGNYKLDRLAEIIPRRIQAVAYALDSTVTPPPPEPLYTDTTSIDLQINVKDVRPLAFLWDDITLLSQARMSASVIQFPGGRIDADINGTIPALLVQNKSDTTDGVDLRIFDTTHVLLKVTNFISDPNTLLDSLRATVAVNTDSTLRLLGMNYSRPKVTVEYGERDFAFDVGTSIGEDLSVYLRGGGGLALTTFDITFDSLAVQLNNILWQSEQATNFRIDPNGLIELDTLRLYRPELGHDPERRLAQRIEVGGVLRNDTIEYAFVHTPQLKLLELPEYFSDTATLAFVRDFRGRVSDLDVTMKGPLTKPEITGNMLVRNFSYQDIFLDSFYATFTYDDFNLSGKLRLHVDSAKYAVESLRAGRQVTTIAINNGLDISIDSLPLLVSFVDYPDKERDEAIVEGRRVALQVKGTYFPINLLTPVLPFVSDMAGFADITLDARGTRENLQLTGEAVFENGMMTVAATNVPYTFSGKVEFARDHLLFPDFTLLNLPSDDPSGRASLTGRIDLEGFSLEKIDFTIQTNRLTVLNDDSRYTVGTVYGPLAIQTGSRPLHFYGPLDALHLDGDITVPQAYLTMPQSQTGSKAKDKGIIYRVIDLRETALGDTVIVVDTIEEFVFLPTLYDKLDRFAVMPTPWTDTTDLVPLSSSSSGGGYDFVDALLYDQLTINIPGDTWLNIYLANTYFGDQISAELRSEGPLRIHRSRPGPENVEFTGKLLITDRSSYKFLKDFAVKGSIQFFNELTNPRIDVTAEYEAPHADPDRKDEIYKVVIGLSGMLEDPDIRMELYRKSAVTGNFVRENRSQDELTADILLFLAVGKFQNDRPPGQDFQNALASSVPSSFMNALLSNFLGSSALRNYIRSVSLEGGVFDKETSRLEIVGGFKDISFRASSGFQNEKLRGDYILEIPLSSVLTFNNADALLLQLEAHLQDVQTEVLSQPPQYVGRFLFRVTLK